MSLIDKIYPDTFKGGQQCRKDVDSLKVIMHEKEPIGYSKEFLMGFRNPNGFKKYPWDERGWKPE